MNNEDRKQATGNLVCAKVTLDEHTAADCWDPNRTWEREDARTRGAVSADVRDAYRNGDAPSREDLNGILRTVPIQAYESVRRERREDPELLRASLNHGLLHERPSPSLMRLFPFILWLLIAAEIAVAVVQWLLGYSGFAVVLMGILLTVGGVLAGKGLARWVHAAWTPGPDVRFVVDRIRWPSSLVDDVAKLAIGLLLIIGVGTVRVLGSGVVDGVIVAIVTVGLALAIAVVEAVLTEWKFRYAALHGLVFEASEILADRRHRANRDRGRADVERLTKDPEAVPTSSWIATAQRTILEQEQHRLEVTRQQPKAAQARGRTRVLTSVVPESGRVSGATGTE